MSNLIIVSNTSPIIYFATIGKLTLLKDLYSKVYIPTEVWNELTRPITLKEEKLPPDIKYEMEAKEAG
jgi:predicted nucleic acid-binding protein